MKTWEKQFRDKFANLRVSAFNDNNFVGYLDRFGRMSCFEEKEIVDFIKEVEKEALKSVE